MALAIDSGSPTGVSGTGGSNANTQTTLATSATYTLSNAGCISIVGIMLEKETGSTLPGVTSVTDGTNTYTLRNRIQYTVATATASNVSVELWWAYSSTTLTSATVTATCSTGGGFTNGIIMAWGVTGFTGTAYQTNPWDQSAATALGWAADSTSTTASAIVSNSYSNVSVAAMLISVVGTPETNASNINTGDSGTLAGQSAANKLGVNTSAFGLLGMRGSWSALTVAANDTGTATASTTRTYISWAILPDVLAQAGGGTTLNMQSLVMM
jgi:hypothetical protein